MRKIIIILLTLCSLFVSCASTSGVDNETEKSYTFKLSNCDKKEICVVDDPILRRRFNTFNELYFKNKLKVDYIGYMEEVYNDNGQVGGLAICNPNEFHRNIYGITIDSTLKDSAKDSTLLHEMVHIYFYQKNMLTELHGKKFCKKINELNKLTNYVYRIPKN
jgi:hypothetical protein